MTISFGFRAPNYKTLMTAFLEEITSKKYLDASDLFHKDDTTLKTDGKRLSAGLLEQSSSTLIAENLKQMVSND